MPRQCVVGTLDEPPCSTLPSLVVVDHDPERSIRRHKVRDQAHRAPHRSGVMEDTPCVHDVELADCFEETLIESAASLNPPIWIIRRVASAQLCCARDRRGIEVEAHDSRSEASCCKAKESAPGSNVAEAQTLKVRRSDHRDKGPFAFTN